ncbi:MAG: 3-phosphoserine/phosphohydroxythreonine transaminase [Lentisphaeria bacterium]
MEKRTVYNFSPGPATLPEEVMKKAQAEFVNYDDLGYGICEASHRGEAFKKIMAKAKQDITDVMGIPDDYEILFLQGGASLQFVMTPMNLAVDGKPALYADTGSWTAKAIKEARLLTDVELTFEGKDYGYTQLGCFSEWENITRDASYLYICSNNTIAGTQYHLFPELEGVPLVADMSSDIMSRRIDVSKFGLIFAGAQKNMGPAGVTLVIIRKDLAERVKNTVPTMLKYSTHIEKDSAFNTPPVFAIYMVGLVAEWVKEQGGLEAVERINEAKAGNLYECIDATDFYQGAADEPDRSNMNVTFRLPTEELEQKFLKEAAEKNLIKLKGHRSVGGIRASIYNAMPLAGVSALIDFMTEFERNNG